LLGKVRIKSVYLERITGAKFNMQRYTVLIGTLLFSLAMLAGCAKTGVDTAGVGPDGTDAGVVETSSVDDSGNVIESEIGDAADASDSDANLDNLLDQKAIYFDFDDAKVSEDSQRIIRAHAEVLSDYPDASVAISGHADERGTREYNLALGDQRGEAVSAFFQEFGIDSSRISVVSFGEERPAVVGFDESAWSLNRRAEFEYELAY
jgi:peptidoglycan-associated lipoprotein